MTKRGSIGGKARAAKLTPDRRSEIARTAALARWEKPQTKAPPPHEDENKALHECQKRHGVKQLSVSIPKP